MKYIIAAILAMSSFLKPCPAQTPLKQYTTANGIISNTVYNAYKDSKGYLWFATDKGLSVYDGYNFRNYTILDGLSDNDIFKVYEDKQGRLWLFNYNGTPCYIKDGKVHNQHNDTFLKKLPVISYINAMYDGGDKGLYIGYITGQVVLLKEKNIKSWMTRSMFYNGISSFYSSGNLVTTIGGVTRQVFDGDRRIALLRTGMEQAFSSNNKLLISDSVGLKVYDGEKLIGVYDDRELTFNNALSLYCGEGYNIFCSCKNGLAIVNYKLKQKTNLLRNFKATSVVQDMQGNYWITTIGTGIFCLNKDFREFRFIKGVGNERIDFTNDNRIFFSGDNKVWELKDTGLQPVNMQFESKLIPLYNNEHFFFFTDGVYAWMFNKKKESTFNLHCSLKFIFPYLDNGLFMIGFDTSMYDSRISGDKLVMTSTIRFHKRVIDARINKRRDKVVLLQKDALYQYNLINKKLSLIDTFKDGLAVSMAVAGNYALLLINNGQVATYDMDSHQKRTYISKDLSFYSFFEIDSGNMLVNTNNGYYLLHDFHGDLHEVTQEKLEYPIRQSDILSLYPFHDSILCNVNGSFYVFSKKLLNKRLTAPTFYIDKIVARNRTYDTGPVVIKNVSECNVSVFLHGLGFNNLRNNYKYRVRSERATGEWLKSDGTTINVPVSGYGPHQIEIRAVSENNISSPVNKLDISLLPPFYWSWWFISLSAGLIGYLIFLALRLYNKRQQRMYEHELEFMQLENKAINSLLNPHFIFNAINNIQNLVASNAPEMANEYLAKLSRLIRQNIENLQFNFVSLEKELILVKNYIYLQNLRFDDAINLEITHSLDTAGINIPPLLIHTFVENAVVHGFTKQINPFVIKIDLVATSDDYLKITIKDNGKGLRENIDSELPKVSLGIAFTRKRLERIARYYGIKYHLEIADLSTAGETGTMTTLIIHSRLGTLSGVY